MTVLVTGGAGYVGSHTCIELIRAGYPVVIFDNFCNSCSEVVDRIAYIAGATPAVIRGDVRDVNLLTKTLAAYRCSAVLHFAGLKSVDASIENPIQYYDNNVVGTLRLLQAMHMTGVRRLIYSSSATIYGKPLALPLSESHPLAPNCPYGQTKMMAEKLLGDVAASSCPFSVAVLRYFNPAGAHESGLMGEDPLGVPNNLMPFLAQVAVGRRPHLIVFGNNYETPDGTGVRDYVHVMDIAVAHVRALERIDACNYFAVNLSTGRGSSVLDLVQTFSKVCGREIPYVFGERRNGDIASCYASPQMARQVLDWRAERNLEDICRDAWRWQRLNPHGYQAQPMSTVKATSQ